jgi:GH43 family beta-xylosidase
MSDVERGRWREDPWTTTRPERLLRGVFGLLAVAAGACSSAVTASNELPVPPQCTFTNPVATGADPWVLRKDGSYYFIESRDNAIYVYRSSELTNPKRNGVKVWTAPDTGWNRTNVWAPELHFIDGRWYIYYAAGRAGPPFVSQRAGVLESASLDPQGSWTDRGMLYTGDDVATNGENIWAIDLTVARLGGQLYAVWSGWESNQSTDRTPQHLYVAKMSNPWTISGDRVKLSSPTEPWERGTELDLQEGPEFLTNGAHTFIVYSARESWLRDYRLGLLRVQQPGSDLTVPSSVVKVGPVFTGEGIVYGVGHASFTTSPDGSEPWIVYHSKVDSLPGWNRVIRMQKFTWKADGSPDFGRPTTSTQPVPMPSGQCTS